MVITSIVMDVMHFITISCNLKIDALHFTHHYLKKCNDCNALPLHIPLNNTHYHYPGLLLLQEADKQTNQCSCVRLT